MITRLLTSFLCAAKPPRPSDAIVILGGGIRPDGSLPAVTRKRVAAGVRLFAGGFAGALLMSGGGENLRFTEAEVMREAALALGIPADRILIENSSINTFENACYSATLLRARGWTRVILVTSPTHLRRATTVFAHAGIDARGYLDPEARPRLYAAGRELVGIGLYKLLGFM